MSASPLDQLTVLTAPPIDRPRGDAPELPRDDGFEDRLREAAAATNAPTSAARSPAPADHGQSATDDTRHTETDDGEAERARENNASEVADDVTAPAEDDPQVATVEIAEQLTDDVVQQEGGAEESSASPQTHAESVPALEPSTQLPHNDVVAENGALLTDLPDTEQAPANTQRATSEVTALPDAEPLEVVTDEVATTDVAADADAKVAPEERLSQILPTSSAPDDAPEDAEQGHAKTAHAVSSTQKTTTDDKPADAPVQLDAEQTPESEPQPIGSESAQLEPVEETVRDTPRATPDAKVSPTAESARSATPLGTLGRLQQSSPTSSRASATGDPASPRVESGRFVSRVARALRLSNERGGVLQLRLSPPELGSLRLEVSVQHGVLTATIDAETAAARTALLDNLPILRERLAEQDIRIDQFDVDVNRDQHEKNEQFEFDDRGQQAPTNDQRQSTNEGDTTVPIDPSITRTSSVSDDGNLDLVA